MTNQRTWTTLVFVALAISLTGCTSLTGMLNSAHFKPAAPPPEGQALVYFFRPRIVVNSDRTPVVSLNDKELCRPSSGQYCWAYLPAGPLAVRSKWGSDLDADNTLASTAEAGKTYYVRLTAPTLGTGTAVMTYGLWAPVVNRTGPPLEIASESVALKQMRTLWPNQ